MSLSTPSVRADGDDVIVEAPTAEAALELVAEQLGTRARIGSVERVRRGGVGGFFARELVQVVASAGPVEADDGGGPRTAADLVLERIQRDDPFAAVLGEQLEPGHGASGDDPGVRAAAARIPPPDPEPDPGPGPAGPSAADLRGDPDLGPTAPLARVDPHREDEPAGTPQREPGGHDAPVGRSSRSYAAAQPPAWAAAQPRASRAPGAPRWTLTNLSRLGLAGLLSERDVAGLEPDDDLGWTTLLARRLAPLCVPPPDAPTIVVGPRAGRLADALKLVVCRMGGSTPRGSFIAPIGDGPEEREWLRAVRGTRLLHLVVGDADWRGLLFEEPSTLSWTGGGVCDAIGLAAQLGLRLGYSVPHAGVWSRSDPIDLAVAVRRLLAVDC